MQPLNLPTILFSLSSLLLPPALSSSPPQKIDLTLHIPPTIPALHHSTRAFLTTHSGISLVAPLTRAQSFVFHNLTTLLLPRGGSESYNLDIGSREYDFAPMLVIVGGDKGRRIEVVRRGGAGGEVKRAEGGGWEVRVLKARDGWDERSGFNPMSLLKNPMILLGLFGFAFVIGMPYLLDTMDPETRAEFEEQQKKSILNTNRGPATSLQNFDMAAWMAGKTSSGSSPPPIANAKGGAGASSSKNPGGSAGGGAEGKGESTKSEGGKARRRG